jgi:hypothetical protein
LYELGNAMVAKPPNIPAIRIKDDNVIGLPLETQWSCDESGSVVDSSIERKWA